MTTVKIKFTGCLTNPLVNKIEQSIGTLKRGYHFARMRYKGLKKGLSMKRKPSAAAGRFASLTAKIGSLFYERTLASRNKTSMLKKRSSAKPADILTAEEEIKDPLVLEFLGLEDEYSETDLEDALIHHLEQFLLELGGDLTFVGRQRRLRIGDGAF